MFNRRNIFFIIFILLSFGVNSSEISKTIYASWDKPDVELLYKLPKEINKDTKVLFIIHGASRDVNRYIESWIDSAKNKNVILIAPSFSEESFPFFSTLELATSSGKMLKNSNKTLTNSISSFYTFFKSKYNLSSDTYLIYGFSGGSQFVHRYMMFGEDNAAQQYYFVHSYQALPKDPKTIASTVKFGSIELTAAVGNERVTGVQFHPEKSGENGLKFLSRVQSNYWI